MSPSLRAVGFVVAATLMAAGCSGNTAAQPPSDAAAAGSSASRSPATSAPSCSLLTTKAVRAAMESAEFKPAGVQMGEASSTTCIWSDGTTTVHVAAVSGSGWLTALADVDIPEDAGLTRAELDARLDKAGQDPSQAEICSIWTDLVGDPDLKSPGGTPLVAAAEDDARPRSASVSTCEGGQIVTITTASKTLGDDALDQVAVLVDDVRA